MLKCNFDKQSKNFYVSMNGDLTRLVEELTQLNYIFLQECKKRFK